MTHPDQANTTDIERITRAQASAHVFTKLMPDEFAQSAENDGPLKDKVLSVKDLFDIKGQITRAGSPILADAKPAIKDATAVERLKAAGARVIGRTTMTELAYSGLGLNPHDGTPENPLFAGHIPGGSTSGGAVSVATGLADITLGSDTGGSLRIPAAFCGLCGFKPTQSSVPMAGAMPLSESLDSVGPMARDVTTCMTAWQVMAGRPVSVLPQQRSELIVPLNFGLTDLDPAVATGFDKLREILTVSGWKIREVSLPVLDAYGTLPVWQFSAFESLRRFKDKLAKHGAKMDPRVRVRMERGLEISETDFATTLAQRADLITAFRSEIGDALVLLPTVAIQPPRFDDVATDEGFSRLNLLALRNTSLANVMDGCSISLPFGQGEGLIGAMLTGFGVQDETILGAALAMETDLAHG
ncbi:MULTISPECIES: amidase family protein [Pacificibacter]|uniref:amidase family protein n=1 Tax=Pacificibacter TaxID=1042323 RepID=UPI001C0A068F|nr:MULTISPECIES: amidase family protein [Pacificibacter]MBU2937544.1 amidase [Pacificibacter marinus]MDO6616675.1 amidase family protein [Pacificibacter sp. 1_MG-2023]